MREGYCLRGGGTGIGFVGERVVVIGTGSGVGIIIIVVVVVDAAAVGGTRTRMGAVISY